MNDMGCVFGTKKKKTAVAQHFSQIVTDVHHCFPLCKVHQHNEHGMKKDQTHHPDFFYKDMIESCEVR